MAGTPTHDPVGDHLLIADVIEIVLTERLLKT
jgi:hypothetical protein